jgi:competence protein ComEA
MDVVDRQIASVDSVRQASRAGARAGRQRGRSGSSSELPPPILVRERVPPVPPPPVDLNVASSAEIERLPRIGPALAQRIIAWREAHGPFRSMDDLRHVRGIGPATAALLAPSVTF